MIHSYFEFNQKHKNGKKFNKVCIIVYLLLQINIKGYELNATIIYTKMTNNDDIKQIVLNYDSKCLKRLLNDST